MAHRVEHLRRGHHRLAARVGRLDDLLLENRDACGGKLDAQVAAGDDQAVGFLEDLVQRIDRLGALDLRQHRDLAPGLDEQPSRACHVAAAADERDGEPVGAELDGGSKVARVLGGDRRDRERAVREVDALVVAYRPAAHDLANHFGRALARHVKLDAAVVDQDAIPTAHVAGQGGVGHGQPTRWATPASGPQPDPLPRPDAEGPAGQLSDAESGALEIGQQSDRPAGPARGLP